MSLGQATILQISKIYVPRIDSQYSWRMFKGSINFNLCQWKAQHGSVFILLTSFVPFTATKPATAPSVEVSTLGDQLCYGVFGVMSLISVVFGEVSISAASPPQKNQKTWTFIWLVFSGLRSSFTWCFFLHTEGYIGALKTLNMMNWADTHRHWILTQQLSFILTCWVILCKSSMCCLGYFDVFHFLPNQNEVLRSRHLETPAMSIIFAPNQEHFLEAGRGGLISIGSTSIFLGGDASD